MSASTRWMCPHICRGSERSIRFRLTVALFLLFAALSASCATARRLVSPAPLMSPDTVATMTAWVQATDSLQDLRFTQDALVITPEGEVSGGLAAESFANGTLGGQDYAGVALSENKDFVCDGRVVIMEGDYHAVTTNGGAPHPVSGQFIVRAIVDAQGTPRVNLVRLNTTRGVRTATLASGCNEPKAFRFANRPRGMAIFGLGMPLTLAQGDAIADLKSADWLCPAPTTCTGSHKSASAGFFAQAYTRLHPGYGIQLVAGRLWEVDGHGYRIADHPRRSGPLTLRNTIDVVAPTLYVERRNLRLAAGPALLRSSWSIDANIPTADSLGFNAAHTKAIEPALVGAASLMLPIGSRVDLEVTAVGDLAPSVAPPSLLEFQPAAINASAVALAIGLGIRP